MNLGTCATVVTTLLASAQVFAQTRFAVVVGVNESHTPAVAKLHYADDDALAIHRLFLDAGIQSELLTELDVGSRRLNPEVVATPPTLENLWQAVRKALAGLERTRDAGQNSELLFYYSGHGDVQDGEGFVQLAGGRLTRSDLFEQLLARSPATRNHVLIDACKSYFMVYGKGAGGARRTAPSGFSIGAGAVRFPNTGFVLSTSSDQQSHEWEQFQAGVFSHEVRSALRGGADGDRDGSVSYGELGAFLVAANAGIANERYRPKFVVRAPGAPPGDLNQAVFAWKRHQASLNIDRPVGHVYVENQRGDRILDAHPADSQSLGLFLPAERPLFVRAQNGRQEFTLLTREPARLSALEGREAKIHGKGSLAVAFEKLFSEPFAAGSVATYASDYGARIAAQQQLERHHVQLERQRAYQVSWKATAHRVSFWTTIGAGAVAISTAIGAWERSAQTDGASQARREELNATIRQLRTVTIVSSLITVSASAVWLLTRGPTITVTPVGSPASPHGGAIVLGTHW